jgi:hypothetical protein
VTSIGHCVVSLFLVVVLLILTPLIYVLMMLDIRRLTDIALGIEPDIDAGAMNGDAPRRGIVERFLVWFCRPVIIAVLLPLIAIAGAFVMIWVKPTEEDSIIW